MSKVFKSEQCIQTEPCKLETIEVNIPVLQYSTTAQAEFDAMEQEEMEELSEETKAERLLERTRVQVQEMLEHARSECEQLKEEAILQAEKIKAESEKNGLEQGRAAGFAAVKTELANHLEKSLTLLNEAEILREERIVHSESELIRLAVAIAEKVIIAELKIDGQAIQAIVRNAIQKISGANRIKVRLHPDDLELLNNEGRMQFDEVLNEPKPITFEADSSVKNGGCFIETEMGNVDARVKVQCERIVIELLKVGHLL